MYDGPALFFIESNVVDDSESVVEANIEQEILPQQFIDATTPSAHINNTSCSHSDLGYPSYSPCYDRKAIDKQDVQIF